MDWEVVWTQPAAEDLEAIVRYLARRSEVAADTIRSGILKHVKILGTFPLIGPRYAKDEGGQTREIVYRSYRIFYRVDETARRIEILTVWYGARGEPHLPNGPIA
jgi:plasmid stabilization system protein ParE